jgi:putative ABC transport system ATP-binding protein
MFKLTNVKYHTILNIKEMMIPEKRITCLIGDSGSGKTTLFKLLVKLISPTEGEIYYCGELLENIPTLKHRKNVVFLSQKAHIFDQTIKDNLVIGLNYHQKSYTEDDLLNALKIVRLNKDLNDDAKTLSGGEQQRLALARVLLLDASVYILDEPSSALDTESEKIMVDALVSFIKSEKKTLIMVTHNLEIAKKYADLIIDLNSLKKESTHD